MFHSTLGRDCVIDGIFFNSYKYIILEGPEQYKSKGAWIYDINGAPERRNDRRKVGMGSISGNLSRN